VITQTRDFRTFWVADTPTLYTGPSAPSLFGTISQTKARSCNGFKEVTQRTERSRKERKVKLQGVRIENHIFLASFAVLGVLRVTAYKERNGYSDHVGWILNSREGRVSVTEGPFFILGPDTLNRWTGTRGSEEGLEATVYEC
jgi:hypothetical protein